MKVFINDLSVPIHAALADYVSSKGYEVLASVPTPSDVMHFKYTVVPSTDPQAVTRLMLSANAIVLSLLTKTTREVDELLTVLTYTDLEERKQLILLSSLLTWARMERPHTAGMGGGGAVGGPVQLMASLEPLDGPAITPPTANANVEVGGSAGGGWGGGVLGEDMRHKYTEDDYHGRRPAVGWTERKVMEAAVLSGVLADKLHTCVVAAGLLYDQEGGDLQHLVREAWFSGFSPVRLPTWRSGGNRLPTIHSQDLVAILHALIRSGSAFPKPYLIAADKGLPTLGSLTNAISKVLGSGQVQMCTKPQFQDLLIDVPQIVNLQVDLGFLSVKDCAVDGMVEDGLQLSPYYHDGLLQHTHDFAMAFRKAFSFPVVKLLIVGPPSTGKTWLAKKLAQRYRLPLLDGEEMLRLASQPDVVPGEEKQGLRSAAAKALSSKQMLDVPGDVASAVHAVLGHNTCTSKGYILDGAAATPEQFKQFFTSRSYGDPAEPNFPPPELLASLPDVAPTHVIIIEATDEFILSRVSEESDKASLTARLSAYRKPMVPPNKPGWEAPPFKAKPKGPPPPPTALPAETLPEVIQKVMSSRGGSSRVLSLHMTGATDADLEAIDWIEKDVGQAWERNLRRLEGGGDPSAPSSSNDPGEALQIKSFDRTAGSRSTGSLPTASTAQLLESNNGDPSAMDEDDVLMQQGGPVGPAEFEELGEESEQYRRYLMSTVMPVLAKALLQVKLHAPDDPIEAVAQACIRAGKKLEVQAEAKAFLLYKGAVAKEKLRFEEEMAIARALAEEEDAD